jgi:hypothetical protein
MTAVLAGRKNGAPAASEARADITSVVVFCKLEESPRGLIVGAMDNDDPTAARLDVEALEIVPIRLLRQAAAIAGCAEATAARALVGYKTRGDTRQRLLAALKGLGVDVDRLPQLGTFDVELPLQTATGGVALSTGRVDTAAATHAKANR